MNVRILCTLLASTALMGCAHNSGFRQLAPGMTTQQVYDLMGSGPSKAREFKDGSVAWFYGNNACVRIREDLVVAKEVTEENANVWTPWVGVTQQRIAQCAPPDETVDSVRTDVHTPFGTFSGGGTGKPVKTTSDAK